nr:ankyrin repeat domain-containing protein 27-like [Anolis sagrei ordinatus]
MKETPSQCALNSTILSLMELKYFTFERGKSTSQPLDRASQQEEEEDTISQVSSVTSLSSAVTTAASKARQGGTKATDKELQRGSPVLRQSMSHGPRHRGTFWSSQRGQCHSSIYLAFSGALFKTGALSEIMQKGPVVPRPR